jgi:ribosomal protein S6--L-glutamate ligase
MRIGVLSQNSKLYSTKKLVEAARKRGHTVALIDPAKCYMNITSNNPLVYMKGKALSNFDAIIPRIGASITFYACAVLRQFEMMGVFSINDSEAIGRARDKLRSLQLLSRAGVPLPSTGFAHSPDDRDHVIDLCGGAPLVLKLLEGTQGKGVVLAETKQAAESVIDAFKSAYLNILIQQFVPQGSGKKPKASDIRCFVIGDQVVASMKRQAKEGEFRSNLHRGGTATNIKITKEERAIAIKASQTMGLNVSGVDIMRSKNGPVVLEVNSSPGLEGIETTTEVDIASLIIQFIEQSVN